MDFLVKMFSIGVPRIFLGSCSATSAARHLESFQCASPLVLLGFVHCLHDDASTTAVLEVHQLDGVFTLLIGLLAEPPEINIDQYSYSGC
ncbi:hypothetical protein Y032_0113g378 [Ancylostoma ceylanicum]|uniref:Uncharacterized protein n=1 Tax=Ancylostoma ceylanicum TaxID=53326 RepID=A0A016TDH4_9BILA|nr:hypothetical protein Y032_0113g378 [Ancylostoma ceylanicum]